ncbi:glycosyltransferase family 1 protein [Mycetocola sp. JXN-3]|uniref:glycosyltransferase family 4 protein n=1 Tax=Mycetocola sp. JXN-3 TaxID=2116510 RepID=UPI00165CEDE4|nr:glycosyltransferase family 1 protein [Mycetocola sp. JXN-3]
MPIVVCDLLSYTGTKGGMETYTRELYRALGALETGIEFIGFASVEASGMDLSWFPGRTVNSGISGENRVAWARGELFAVSKFAKSVGADLIHSPASLGPMRSKIPVVLTLHDVMYWSHPEMMTTPLYTEPVKWMETRATKNAARVITISEFSKSEIQRFMRIPDERIEVIPLAGARPTERPRSVVPGETPYILATGNRRPHKNWDGLIRGLARVDEDIRPRLVITGSHGTEDPLRAVVAETGMTDWVDLRGWLSAEELGELYEHATALGLVSFVEGFGLPALEAMMIGLPAILSDIPAFREICGDDAVYADPHSIDSIADAITRLMTDPTLAARLAEAGPKRAAQYSWPRVAERTLEVFRGVLG